MIYGLWIMDYGLWFMVHGVWCMVYGVWCMVYGLSGSLDEEKTGACRLDHAQVYRGYSRMKEISVQVM